MIDAVLVLWLSLFVFLMLWFFILQPKLGSYYMVIKSDYDELLASCRPRFILARYNEQLVFLIFMYKKKYEYIPDEYLMSKGRKYRKYILTNSVVTTFFLVNTIVVILIGSTGNL